VKKLLLLLLLLLLVLELLLEICAQPLGQTPRL
jgi:hypothetical protein